MTKNPELPDTEALPADDKPVRDLDIGTVGVYAVDALITDAISLLSSLSAFILANNSSFRVRSSSVNLFLCTRYCTVKTKS